MPQQDPLRCERHNDTPDWPELVGGIRAGRTEAVEQLYAIFARGIRLHLCRRLGPEDLDDKTHEAFLIVLDAIRQGKLRDPERLAGFIWGVLRNQVLKHIELRAEERQRHADLQLGFGISDRQGTPEDGAIARQRTEIMSRALHHMGKQDREVLTRFYLMGESPEQICAKMYLTQTQFRLLKSRAKARFGELGRQELKVRRSHDVEWGTEQEATELALPNAARL